MTKRPLLLLLPLALWACQDALYPVAPDVPERVTVGSPDPGDESPVVQRGPFGGRMVKSGTYYLEFVGFTPSGGSYTLYLFPWDASLNPVMSAPSEASAKLKASNGQEFPMAAAANSDDGSLFFYAFPGNAFKTQTATLQAEAKIGSTALTGSFTHPDR